VKNLFRNLDDQRLWCYNARMRTLAQYEPLLSQVMRVIARETHFTCRPGLGELLSNNSRLVIVLSHSTPLSWLPSASLLALHACARGGRERTPMGVMDNFFFNVPGLKELAKFLTQSEKSLSYQELSDRFETKGDIDLVLFPEGSNCFFGKPDEIQEFRSPKFVDLAIRTSSPILIGVHKGSESWAKALEVPKDVFSSLKMLPNILYDFAEKRIRKTGLFTLPVLPLPMAKFEMLCELYYPTLKVEDLSDDVEVRFSQIKAEAEKVRERMRELLIELNQKPAIKDPDTERIQ
jgi:hypothetical protein